jgi:hypothetical protein
MLIARVTFLPCRLPGPSASTSKSQWSRDSPRHQRDGAALVLHKGIS